MKKSVIILIAVIYIASIALVTFFGLKHNTFFEDKKVTDISIANEGIKYTRDGEKYIVIPMGADTFQIEYTVGPEDASNKNVTFVADEQSTIATVDQNGLVTFNKPGSIIIYVMASDGSGCSDSIEVTKIR